jgi:hypothetical protein
MLQWMGFKYFFTSALLALPWLTNATPGPVAQLGAWLAAFLEGMARLACHAKMQHHGFFQTVDFCWREGGYALLESFFVCGHDLV